MPKFQLGVHFWGAHSGIGIVGISQTIIFHSQATLIIFQSGCKTFIVTLLNGSDCNQLGSEKEGLF